MAARIGISSVSYGIGVQNRYSAFLDDGSGFQSPNSIAAIARKRTENVTSKQKTTSNLQNQVKSTTSNSLTGKPNGRIAQKNKIQDHQKSGNQTEQKRAPLDGKRQRANAAAGQQHLSANNSVQAPRQMANNRPQGNNNLDNTANNNNRSSRNHQNSNYNHQSNVSHNHTNFQPNNNNENSEFGQQQQQQQQGKYVQRNNTGNQRARRQYHNDDKKAVVPNLEEGTSNSFIGGTQSNEEEKRRRQQKRALDMKHKDPEKREARRQQVAPDDPSTNSSGHQADLAQSESGQRNGPRNRRQVGDGTRNPDDVARAGYRSAQGAGGGRGRGRREPGVSGASGETNGERREGQQVNRVPRGDRPQRNRNGFDSGSRTSRGSRGEDHGKFARDSERQRPIPNFSDKSDFPSLAS